MKLKEISIAGKKYPLRLSMGAMLEFKEMTGKDVSKLDGELSEVVTLLFCGVKSGCRVSKRQFNLSLQEFADELTAEEITEYQQEMLDGEKKSAEGENN